MTEAAYSIVDIIDGKVTVLQGPRAKRFNPLKEISLGSMRYHISVMRMWQVNHLIQILDCLTVLIT